MQLNLPQPDITIIPDFADYPALIVHRGFDEAGGDLTTDPIGTGPWELVSCDVGVKRGLQEAHQRHLVGRHRRRHGPVYLDGVEYIDYGTDPSATIAGLRVRRDPHQLRDPAELRRDLRRRSGWTKSEAVTANTLVRADERRRSRPSTTRRCATPCSSAVDNAVVLDLGYQGLGTVAENHHVGPMHPEYAELPPPARDPDEAKALMTEAGHADTELELISLDDDFNRNTCDAVAAQLRDAGIN